MTVLRRVTLGEGDLSTTAYNTQKVSLDKSLFSSLFTFDVSPALWDISENGLHIPNSTSSKATSVDGRLNITSGLSVGDKTLVESKKHPRYQPNRGMLYSSSLGFEGATNDGILKAGYFIDGENGAYFKTIGDGLLYACILKGGVETHAEPITVPFVVDITLGNLYDIQFQWRGVGSVSFFITDPNSGQITLVREIKFLNTLDGELLFNNPTLAVAFYAETVTEEVSLWCGCVDLTSEGGGTNSLVPYSYSQAFSSISSGTPLFVLKSPDTINSLTNTRDIKVLSLEVESDAKVTLDLYVTKDETLITGGSFATFNVGSYIEVNDTATSITTAGMKWIRSIHVPSGGSKEVEYNDKDIEFFLTKGEYLVVMATVATSANIECTFEYGEEI